MGVGLKPLIDVGTRRIGGDDEVAGPAPTAKPPAKDIYLPPEKKRPVGKRPVRAPRVSR